MNFFPVRHEKGRGSYFPKYLRALVVVLGTVLLCLPAFAQGNFGRVLGAVTDQTGGVVSGATVTILDTQRGLAATLTSDSAGEYNAPTLIPSTYTVSVEAKGFKKLERQNVVVEVGKEGRLSRDTTRVEAYLLSLVCPAGARANSRLAPAESYGVD